MNLPLPRLILHLKDNSLIYLIFFSALVIRLLFLSPYLEDWDSVQFALSLHKYSIVDQLPHPPGYPVYVFLARLLNFYLQNDLLSLNLLSALLGAGMAIPFYFLVKKMTSHALSLLVTILLLITPVSWTLSEVPLSNIAGLAFLITTAYFLYRGKTSTKYLLIGCYLGGFILGIRFAEYSIVLPLMTLVILSRKGQSILKSIFFFILGILTWLIPMLAITGISQFIKAYTNQIDYIVNHDSLLSTDTSLRYRLFRIKQLLSWGYTPYFILFLAPLILVFIKRINFFKFDVLFALVWLFSYLIPLTFAYNLEVTRYTLPLLPPILIISAISLYYLKSKPLVLLSIFVAIPIFLNSFDQVQKIHSQLPPTIAPIKYVKENFSPENTTLITTFTYRQFEYYAPEFINFYGADRVKGDLATDIVIIDLFNPKDRLPLMKNYQLAETKVFQGPEIIFPRVSKTTLYIFRKN